jgi:hypothetical protein
MAAATRVVLGVMLGLKVALVLNESHGGTMRRLEIWICLQRISLSRKYLLIERMGKVGVILIRWVLGAFVILRIFLRLLGRLD